MTEYSMTAALDAVRDAVKAKTCRHCGTKDRADLCGECARCARCSCSPNCITRIKKTTRTPKAKSAADRAQAGSGEVIV